MSLVGHGVAEPDRREPRDVQSVKGAAKTADECLERPLPMKKHTLPDLGRTLGHLEAGLAARKLKRCHGGLARRRAAAHLQQRLGRLRGLPQKVGQILSMGEGDSAAELARLQNGGPALPRAEVETLLEGAWGRDLSSVCRDVSEHGLAASLGQVHRATLRDGREVAVKVRYPGIEAAVRSDLRSLGWLSRPLGNLKRGFDLQGYQQVLTDGLTAELDYHREARNQRDVAEAARGTDLIVPEVVEEFSTSEVLVTTWEAGATLDDVRGWPETERAALGAALVSTFLRLTFDHGLVHADPHPGNYAFRRGPNAPRVVLYDYGCVDRLARRERLTILRLLRDATRKEATADPFPLLIDLGFDADLLRPLRHKLPALCAVLFEPFATRGAFDSAQWNRGQRAADILGEDRLNFRAAGSPRLIYFLRAFEGLCYYLRQLAVPVWWSKGLTDLFERYAGELDRLEFAEPADPNATYGCLAESLHIQVTDGGRPRAQLQLPAGAVERLEQFIDGDLADKIAARGISLPELLERVRSNHYAPQEILSLEDGQRRVEVRLA